MTTLGIFTVKTFRLHDGRYYTYGGFGEYLAAIRRHFDKTILMAHVARGEPGAGYYEVPLGDLEIVHLPVWPGPQGVLASIPVMFWKGLQHIKRMDVVHARMPDHTGIVGAIVAGMAGVPRFHQIIDDWQVLAHSVPATRKFGLGLFLKGHLYLYDLLERLVSRRQLVFAQGQTCYDKHAPYSDAVFVLSSAHHLTDIIAPKPRFTAAPFTILSVGRLQAVKNHELLLRVLPKLGPEWRATIVGHGPKDSYLRELAAQLGIVDRVKFTGHLEHGSDLWREFDDADVFFLPSVSEGTPKVILEAMARGLPIVASAVSGVPSMVGVAEERGLLFPSQDAEAAVIALLRIKNDPALRERCMANGHVFARAHTVELATHSMLETVFARWPQLRAAKA
ncbi:MAG: glycosyltransferase [Alphaproteobacteria bacterium]|nr:glycosyltransferase [Alphaproteobacteria bacterium]